MYATNLTLIIHSLGFGGMERVMSILANYFAVEKKAEIHILLIGRKKENVYNLHPSIKIHKPNFKYNDSFRTVSTIRTAYFIRKKIKELNPDAVLSFGEIWNNLVLLALYGRLSNVYISDRSKPGKNLGSIHNYLKKLLYPQASGYIAQTENAAIYAQKYRLNSNIAVIGNPVRKFAISKKTKEHKTVLTVGRLIDTKHFDDLIDIFYSCKRLDWKLVIVGGDAKKQNNFDKLLKLIANKKMTNVFLEGYQSDIDTYLMNSDIFAFTSSSEGFPNVVGEALSAGLPVVAYDCIAGPSDMIADGENGYLIPLFDKEYFRKRLTELMDDKEKRIRFSENAVFSMERYSVNEIANRFYNFITGATIQK